MEEKPEKPFIIKSRSRQRMCAKNGSTTCTTVEVSQACNVRYRMKRLHWEA